MSAFSTRVTCALEDSLDQLPTKFWEVEEVSTQFRHSNLTIQILKCQYFVFNADIEKIYRQIWVDPKHTPLQRILFCNSDGEICDYELKAVNFGVNCASFLAIRVQQQLAEDEESRYPQASQIIRYFMCVDDVLAGADLKTEAHAAIRELQGP
ncbi:uncharacterized protein LOC122625601 [Drosophila teissieri]|uniref:uncharacterized protein LOC122625601 n=1 Tax=Drosophila teissieri TaxID=7243 RepID=UPI001CBA5D3C|nr:uncharacterized protein LOC122625601 [Drosophila teissieri]